MAEQKLNPRDIYELMESSEGEVMLLIFSDGNAPQNASFAINERTKTLELTRNKEETIYMQGLQSETIARIKELNQLYVCEMLYTEDEDKENEIKYAYIANLKKKEPEPEQNNQEPEKSRQEMLSEKARKARQEALNKNNPK